jgi:hypothetical protein
LARKLRFTNASTAFAALAVEGCTSDENYDVLEKHIKEMRSEFEEIQKRKMVDRQNTGATKGGAIEGAQDPGATLVLQNMVQVLLLQLDLHCELQV